MLREPPEPDPHHPWHPLASPQASASQDALPTASTTSKSSNPNLATHNSELWFTYLPYPHKPPNY